MRKEIIRNIVFLSIASVILLVGVVFASIAFTRAWLPKNDHIDVKSSPIYAINQGFGDDLVSLNNLARIYDSSDQTVTQVTFIPGDQVYYTFRFSIFAEDYIASKSDYNIDLIIRGEAQEGASNSTGDYLSFLHDCTIEEDSCMVAILKRGEATENDQTVVYFDIVKFRNDNGTYVIDPNGEVSNFSSETVGAAVNNDEVASFCPDLQAGSISATFDMTIPIVDVTDDIIYTNEGIDYIWFLIYIPIKYIDTGINQNNQMDSSLIINGCTILCKD